MKNDCNYLVSRKGPIIDQKSLMRKCCSGARKFEDPQDCISSHSYQKRRDIDESSDR